MITQNRRSEGRVEDLLRQVAAIHDGAAGKPVASFELWVPELLTLQGRRIPQDVAVVVLLDAALEKKYEPAGFTEEPGGRVYLYQRSVDA